MFSQRSRLPSALAALTAFSTTWAVGRRNIFTSAPRSSSPSRRHAIRRSSTSADCSPRTWVASQAST